jgi:small subunit ribosomal protein S4e
MKEAEVILNAGKVKVDGKVRYDTNYPVGLMDVVELGSGQSFRMVPRESNLLVALPIEERERNVKLAKVRSKINVVGKKLQYGFHDGRTKLSDMKLNVGDTCVLKLPQGEIEEQIRFVKGQTAIIITGENAGRIGKIEDIKDGIFSLPKRALLSFGDRSAELPVESVMVVGSDQPIIKVN